MSKDYLVTKLTNAGRGAVLLENEHGDKWTKNSGGSWDCEGYGTLSAYHNWSSEKIATRYPYAVLLHEGEATIDLQTDYNGIDRQVLVDWLAKYTRPDGVLKIETAFLAEEFNLPKPTPRKKTMKVELEIDVTDRGADFSPLGDTYGAFVELLSEAEADNISGACLVDILENITDQNISVIIEEEGA